ncbi:MAG: efflux RND transporter permease subunit [Desulfobacteraceae bacterium]|nr:MAG: efflux RND transporter permease subunit [Desulfobacteraceae bacterium]
MFSRFFIERPILANVIAILTIILGVVALLNLPVSQYPEITPPTVQVTTRYPGASAKTVAETVALPIEQQVNGVEGMLYMQSTCTNDGSYTLVITFEVGTDLNFAQVLVQNRVAMAMPSLPSEVQIQGVVSKKVSTSTLLVITLSSRDSRYDGLYLSNFAKINVSDVLARVPGVGEVKIVGAGDYSMRVWLNPQAMKTHSLTTTEVIGAIQQQNIQVPAGAVGMSPTPATQDFQYTVNVLGRLTEEAEFENIVVKTETGPGAQLIRIKDIARVEMGAMTYDQFCEFDGKPAVGIGVLQLPGANSLKVAEKVMATMASLGESFPRGIEYNIPFKPTDYTKASINEVYSTLIEAAFLVLLVIMVFLQDWRATLVPATTVPVTIIGAFIAMAAMEFTVNMITLFAVVLAIGIVVDDAIVIVEGAAHGVEQGMAPKEATIKAMSELFGPVMGITLVLMAVFIPAAFLPGITGQLYRQFALVIASTAVISAINAVTLKPAQCAAYLRPRTGRLNPFYRAFNFLYDRCENAYAGLVGRLVRRSVLVMVLFACLIGLTAWGFLSLPTGFLPEEDQGYAVVGVQLPDAASLERTKEVTKKLNAILAETPGVAHWVTMGGLSLLDGSAPLANASMSYLIYDDFERRAKEGLTQEKILAGLRKRLASVQEAMVFAVIPPAIQGLGVSGGFQMQVQLKGKGFDFPRLGQAVFEMIRDGSAQSRLAGLSTSFRPGVPQLSADVDRVKAESLGVNVSDVFKTFQGYLAPVYVNQFNKFGRTYQVRIQADHHYRLEADDIRRLHTRNKQGKMVPLGTMTDIDFMTGPALVGLYNLYPSALISGRAAPGSSSGQAMALMEQIASQKLPSDMGFEWTGISFQEKLVGHQSLIVFFFSALLVFLMLAAQYESWTDPAAVILVLPIALLGTVIALALRGFDNNIYTQIGIVLLIALASKNAILIVEYGRKLREEGKPLLEAAVEASRRRFRPILMTSFAFILGVVPLVFAKGAGAASRQALGTAVVGGMLASTLLAILFVPVFYVVMTRVSEWRRRGRKTAPEKAE